MIFYPLQNYNNNFTFLVHFALTLKMFQFFVFFCLFYKYFNGINIWMFTMLFCLFFLSLFLIPSCSHFLFCIIIQLKYIFVFKFTIFLLLFSFIIMFISTNFFSLFNYLFLCFTWYILYLKWVWMWLVLTTNFAPFSVLLFHILFTTIRTIFLFPFFRLQNNFVLDFLSLLSGFLFEWKLPTLESIYKFI